jgi:hypothetical protein
MPENNTSQQQIIHRGRGRPIGSKIRQNLVEILYFMKEGYGYEIYKVYKELFPFCTQKSIYYHMAKGITTGEFKIKEIKQVKGEYSWGDTVEKIYYELGPNANPIGLTIVKNFFEKKSN